jgi:hypothetical protein
MQLIGDISSCKPGISNIFVKIENVDDIFAILGENSISFVGLNESINSTEFICP